MRLLRSLSLLAISMAMIGFVQAESASLYVHLKKGHRVKRVQTVAVQSARGFAPASQPLDTILPRNARIVEGDDTKNEFYILAEGEQEPVKPIDVNLRQHQMAVDTQLERVDTQGSMWTISNPDHVDDILSQIAHKVTLSEQHLQKISSIKKTMTMPLFNGEKNGDIADLDVALDKVFAEVDARNAVPAASLPVDQSERVASLQTTSDDVVNLAPKADIPKAASVIVKQRKRQHASHRVFSQRAPIKLEAKKLTLKKSPLIQHVAVRHTSRHLAVMHARKSSVKLVSAHKKIPHIALNKSKHKMTAVRKQHHLAVRQHVITHVNA